MAIATDPIKRTFLKEGEITIDNGDTGGLTYLGLAHNSWPKAKIWPTIFKVVITTLKKYGIIVTEQDLKNLGTKSGKNLKVSDAIKSEINAELRKLKLDKEIIIFYKAEFWDSIGGDDICSQSFAESLFDFGINVYWKTAAMILQKILKVSVDGAIGPITIYTLNCELIENHHELHTLFAMAKINKYISISNGSKIKYLHGWLNRTFETYEHNYTIDDLDKMINVSSVDGLIGPRPNIKGYKTYMKNEEHFIAVHKLIRIYKINELYRLRKITQEELLNKIALELNEIK